MIISNEEGGDTMKVVKFLEESCLLIKNTRETIEHEAKGKKGGFLCMLLGTLGVTLCWNMLAEQCVIQAVKGTITEGGKFNVSSSFD